MPIFLARLTQRGHLINNMEDIMGIYNDANYIGTPSKDLMLLPHTTIMRMCYVTIAISGLSTKAVSQLRTHAKRATFMSTSTQYSSFENRENNYVMPNVNLNSDHGDLIKSTYAEIDKLYKQLIDAGIDKDEAGYILPQGLRKAVIISANISDWNYILKTRLCNRNTKEVQYISQLIYETLYNISPNWVVNALPDCVNGKCPERNFSCGKRYVR